MMISKPLNQTQEHFNALCKLGGGKGGGPARTKVQSVLSRSGKQLNDWAYVQAAEHLAAFPDRNPWHVCFAIALSWGHLDADRLTVDKGSICVNGTSLTCFNTTDEGFTVAIIPYTYEHTGFGQLQVGETVNLEFDIVGKYVARMLGRLAEK